MRRLLIGLVLILLTGSVQAQVLRLLTDVRTSQMGQPRWSDDGSLLFVASSADLTGSNPDHRWQVYRFDLSMGTVDQLTALARGIQPGQWSFSVSDDGGALAFVSRDDPTGANPDHSIELFAMNADGTGLTQVTSASGPGAVDRVESSGDGGRLVFGATFDYTGQNPDGLFQVFTVEDDGSGLLQLTAASSGGFLPTISDDGQRVAYIDGSDYTLRGVESDGSNPAQLTTWFTWAPQISGDGGTVVFLLTGNLPNELPGWCFGGTQVGAVDWGGTNPIKLSGNCLGNAFPGSVSAMSVTDDGQTIYHVGRDLFYTARSIKRDATQETGLIQLGTWWEEVCTFIGVSGGGSRFAAACEGLDLAGTNADLSLELYSADPAGQNVVQQTATTGVGDSRRPGLSADGSWVFFGSDANPLAESPHPGSQVYRMRTDGSGLERLSSLISRDLYLPYVNGDGSQAVFETSEFLLGPTRELWIADGSSGTTTQLSTPTDGFSAPDIDDAGNWIVMHRGSEVWRMRTDASEQLQLASGYSPRISGDGNVVAYLTTAGVHRMTIDGANQQFLAGGNDAEISHDGSRVVFASSIDPFATNADGNFEIFLADLAGGGPPVIQQLTFTKDATNSKPVISGDGGTIYYLLAQSVFPTTEIILQRVNVATLATERVTALLPCAAEVDSPRPIDTNFDGSRAVFAAADDCTGDNPDRNLEILLADYAAPPMLRALASQPTRLRWDVSPGVDRYDLIRGQVDEISEAGSTIDLGSVTCLANDWPFGANLGHEDAAVPAPGESRFYLVRGVPDGDYGTDSVANLRVPGVGDCP